VTEEVTETYRRAEQRLRLLLLGDGVSEPGVVKGEEARTRVTTALRQMRESLAEALGAETRASELQDELLRLAAGHTDASAETETLLTPAEVARELDVSVGRVYRAVKRNKIAALRTGKSDRSALRIPASEVGRLRESRG
jgi:excisionase family DNA binding protein